MAEIPLPLFRFFGENMAKVLFLVLNLSSPGKRIALCRAFFGFHLRHAATLNKTDVSGFLPDLIFWI